MFRPMRSCIVVKSHLNVNTVIKVLLNPQVCNNTLKLIIQLITTLVNRDREGYFKFIINI